MGVRAVLGRTLDVMVWAVLLGSIYSRGLHSLRAELGERNPHLGENNLALANKTIQAQMGKHSLPT